MVKNTQIRVSLLSYLLVYDKIDPEKKDNKDEFGKGHEYPTEQTNTISDTRASRSFEASSLIAGWAFAFGCGECATIQPDDVGSPNVYEHTIKPAQIFDSAVGLQLPSTTLVEHLNSLQQNKYRDMVVSEVKLSGKIKEQLKIGIQLIGSGHYEANTMTLPDLAQVAFLRMADAVIMIGDKNISKKSMDFEFTHKSDLGEDKGYHPGSGYLIADDKTSPQIRGHCVATKRGTNLKLKVLMADTDLSEYAKNNTPKSISIVAEGKGIDESYNHKLELTFPRCFLKTTKVGTDGGLYVYDVDVTVGWDNTISAPFQIKITNNVPAYLTPAT